MLSQGVALGNRYRLEAKIAAGGMGEVWRCRDTLLEREVAVKILLPSLVSDPEFTTRFRSEAQMVAALRHPGIVQIHDFGLAALADGSQVPFLVMAYVPGESLLARIRRTGRLSVPETMSIVSQAAQALQAAHIAGIVHRDVKPANFLVRPDGTVVLVDFGIARSVATGNITATNVVIGTASYMSPEQANGRPVTAVTDVYALGAVAYCCLAGKPPFSGDNPIGVAMQHLRDAPPPLPADVPQAAAALVTRALAKEPADRFQSAAEFAAAANAAASQTAPAAALAPAPASAPPPGFPSAPSTTTASPGGFPAAPVNPTASPTSAGFPPFPVSAAPAASAASSVDPRGKARKVALAGAVGTLLLALGVLAAVIVVQPDEHKETPASNRAKLAQQSGLGLNPGTASSSGTATPHGTSPTGIPISPGARQASTESGRPGLTNGAQTSDPRFYNLLATKTDGTLWLFLNSRTNTKPYSTSNQIGSGWAAFNRIVVGDMNGDAWPDIIATKPDGTMWLFTNNGTATQSKPYQSGRQINSGWQNVSRVVAIDINGDRHDDLVAVSSDGSLLFWPNHWTTDPSKPITGTGVKIGSGWTAFDRLIAADVNGDGYDDLLGVKSDGALAYYANGYTKRADWPFNSTPTTIMNALTPYSRILAADVNGDGFDDLLGAKSDGTLWYWVNTTNGTRFGTGRQIAAGLTGFSPRFF